VYTRHSSRRNSTSRSTFIPHGGDRKYHEQQAIIRHPSWRRS